MSEALDVASWDRARCSVAGTLAVVGEKWSLLVLREAFLGVRRFADFQRNLGAPRAVLTHRVDVRAFADRKRASMAAHASQATADSGDRTLAALLRLPRPLYRRVLGREWFVERGRPAGGPLLDDVFATLRGHPGPGRGGA